MCTHVQPAHHAHPPTHPATRTHLVELHPQLFQAPHTQPVQRRLAGLWQGRIQADAFLFQHPQRHGAQHVLRPQQLP